MNKGQTRSKTFSEHRGEQAKLASLLALATGAVAMPQGAEADIIYQNLGAGVHVRPVTADHYYFVGLPGTIKVGFTAHSHFTHTTFSVRKYYKTVNLRKITQSGTANSMHVQVDFAGDGLAKRLNKGASWNAAPTSLAAGSGIAQANRSNHAPDTFDHKYFAWEFTDSTSSGALRYGWIEASLVNSTLVGNSGGPDLTVFGYAWDTTGAKLSMGTTQAPEPSSAALLALGAMALGARGVRRWRNNVPPAKS
jgi:hypothetical protein